MPVFNYDYLNKKDYVSIGQIGSTVAPHLEAPQGVDAQLRSGAKIIEINVADRGGSQGGSAGRGQGQPIPSGAYGIEQRQELKELAEVNKAELRLHAGSSTGFTPFNQQGNAFDQRMWERNLEQFKQDVDFGYDIGAKGMVMHLIGSTRPITELGEKDFDSKKEDQYQFIDSQEGQVMAAFRGDQKFSLPELQIEKVNNEDRFGFKFNPQTGINYLGDNTEKSFNEWVEYFEKEKKENPKKWEEIYSKLGDNSQVVVANHFLKQQSMTEQSEYDAYIQRSRELNEDYNKLLQVKEMIKTPEKLKKLDKKELEEIDYWLKTKTSKGLRFLDERDLDKHIDDTNYNRLSTMERAGFYRKRFEDLENKIKDKRVTTMTEFSKQKNIEGISKLAEHSYEMSKSSGGKNFVEINPENVFPMFYGSHPQELGEVVLESRKKFVENMEKKIGRTEAEKQAEKLIGATFDLGHANLWQYYHKGDKKEFTKWLEKEGEKLAKTGVIKEIQINDNFGYADDSLPLGSGNLSKSVLDKLRPHTKDVPIISEGYGNPRGSEGRQLTRVWESLNPNMFTTPYSMQSGQSQFFNQSGYLENSQRTYIPMFLAGPAVPSEDFKFWSEIPLE